MHSNFLLGQLQLSDDARIKLQRLPMDLIARHAVNDHGNITAAEAKMNALSMKVIGKVISRYYVDPTNKRAGNVLVTTNEEMDATTVTLE